MLHAAVAVDIEFVLVDSRPQRLGEKGLHVLGGVVESARLLHPGAAAEVHDAPGQRGRSTAAAGALEYQHIGAVLRSTDRRGHPRNAVSRDHDVGLEIPGADGLGGNRTNR